MALHDHVLASLHSTQAAFQQAAADTALVTSIVEAAGLMATTLSKQGLLLSCGNGGSMCDAMHFAEELSGRYRRDRPPLAALAMSDPAHLTCVGNDYGFEQVFARQFLALGKARDCLLAISTSGRSPNVIAAARTARDVGAPVIALTGASGSELATHATVEIAVPGGPHADRVQELHLKVIHILVELVERELFPTLYSTGIESQL